MTDRIRKFIGLFFDELPFSEEAEAARTRIEKTLEETAPDAAPDELAAAYGNYEKLGFRPVSENAEEYIMVCNIDKVKESALCL